MPGGSWNYAGGGDRVHDPGIGIDIVTNLEKRPIQPFK